MFLMTGTPVSWSNRFAIQLKYVRNKIQCIYVFLFYLCCTIYFTGEEWNVYIHGSYMHCKREKKTLVEHHQIY